MFAKSSRVAFALALVPVALAHEGREIVARNPQLKSIPDWPALSSNTGAVGVPYDCNVCANGMSLETMQRQGYAPYRCVNYEGRFGGKGWESGAGERKNFTLQLHPGSPMVWRVYPQGGFVQDARMNLIAEFNASGKQVFAKSARSSSVSETGGRKGASSCPFKK